MAIGDSVKESDGNAINVALTATVEKNDLIVVSSWMGFAEAGGDSGENIAMFVGREERQVEIPSTLNAAVGDTIWVDPADLTGHKPDSTAYGTSDGGSDIRLGKVSEIITEDYDTGIDLVAIVVFSGHQ